jgi:hypothetical protein
VTVYITWWFLTFFDKFFSPVFRMVFGFHVFGARPFLSLPPSPASILQPPSAAVHRPTVTSHT